MREYGKVSPTFWTGTTGRELRAAGTESVVVGFYLMTSPASNMLGIYYQPMLYMAHETGLGLEGASKGLQGCVDSGFCKYDPASETVWVVEMAAWQIAEELKASDKRCLGIQRDYEALPANPFLGEFFDRYAECFHLSKRRGIEAPSKDLPSKAKAKAKATEQEKEQAKDKSPIPPSGAPLELAGDAPAEPASESRKMTYAQFVAQCKADGEKLIPSDHEVFEFAEAAGIPKDYLELAWREFAHQYRPTKKTQAGKRGWRQKFSNCVRRNWFKLWWFPAEGQCDLTTAGVQLRRERDAA